MTMAAAVAATCLLAGVARGVVTVTPETKWSYSGATPGVFTDAFTNDGASEGSDPMNAK